MTGDRSLSTPISVAICSRSSRTDMKLVRSSSPASCPSIAGTKLSEIPPSPTQSSIASSTTPTASNSKERASESKSNPPPINRSLDLLINQRHAFWHRSNDRTRARAMLGRALCILGFTEQGYREAAASAEIICKTSDRVSICRVLSIGVCRVAFLIGDLAAADRAITHMIDAANSSNTLFWQIEGRFLEGKLFVERGEFEKGLDALRNGFEEFRQAGWRASYLEFNGALAEALAGTD